MDIDDTARPTWEEDAATDFCGVQLHKKLSGNAKVSEDKE